MSIGPLRRRSSLPSSFITGLIGWNGFFIVIGAVLGVADRAGELFLLATAAAICQIVFLRLLFFGLRLDRGMANGAFWGGVSGLAAVIVEKQFSDIIAAHSKIWLLNGVYIGIAVGLFLCYFYRDDRRIETEAKELERQVDYGRDAHWLEPFFFGVVAYLIAFLPQSSALAVISVVGAMSGVVAAGVSHFFLFSSARRSLVPVALSIVAGVIQGMLSGLLFRSFTADLLFSPLTHGALAGSLTYLMTSLRGRALAGKESGATS